MQQLVVSPRCSKKNLSILIVEDEEESREALRELLSQLGHSCVTASDGLDALEKLTENQFSIVITDISMPRMDGIELIKRIKTDFYDNVDVIAITGHHAQYKYTDIIKSGASDFMIKPFSFDELEAKIKRIARERYHLAQLKQLSIRDGLTELYNRRHFDKNLRHEATRALRQQYDLYLLLIDIDSFKYYNDKYGHREGDNLIRGLAEIVLANIRKNVDSAYRYGGDEFAVILPHAKRHQAHSVGERLCTKYKERNLVPTSLSIGMAKLKYFSDSLEENLQVLISEADKALYRGKGNGGDQVRDNGCEVVSANSLTL